MIESTILTNLIRNEDYSRKVIPYLKSEYFSQSDKVVYNLVDDYIKKYNKLPSQEALLIELDSIKGISDDEFQQSKKKITQLNKVENDLDWLLEKTEKWCQDKAVYNAIMSSISILDSKTEAVGSIPDLLKEALGVSFDQNIGHDFLDNSDERYDFYHKKEVRIPFDLDYMNKITKGGLPKKTLNVALAGTGVGKSLFMCHCASANLLNGHNVLYITLEMAEEKIAERIDANLLNVGLNELTVLPKEAYDKKIARVKNKTTGKLIIKEYPTAQAHTGHFRHLLNELRLKKNFKPDIIYVDYLNICASSRFKGGSNVNSYTLVKAIAEELRGLAVEFDVPLVSATQTTRSGYSNSDVGLEDTSESFGLPATADFMFAIVSTEELEDLNQIMIKQLKNRYGDPNMHRRFVVGIDRAKMKLYDTEQESQEDLMDDTPAFDNTEFGMTNKKPSFSGFK